MADWITLSNENFLTVDKMNAIYNNFLYLHEYLSLFGLEVDIIDNSVEYDTSIVSLLAKFNAVESNIQAVHTVLNIVFGVTEKNYKIHLWTKYAQNLKLEVWRWINWLNEVNRYQIQIETLYDINGEPITDINNETVEVLEIKETV